MTKMAQEDEGWKLSRCDDGYLMVHTLGDIVCHPDRNHQPDDAWDEANFRKIAAAPDMLAALKAVTVALAGRVHSRPALTALSNAEEAIAKAEAAS